MFDYRQQIAIRMALARQAHDDGVVRLANADFAGFDHLVASRAGLFAVNPAGSRLLVHGQFYGIAVGGDATGDGTLYAFEACDRPRTPGNHGRILRIRHAASLIEQVEVFARDLPNGCHQIDLLGDHLFVTDTYNQRLLRFGLDGSGPDIVCPLPPPDADTNAGYAHLNSLLACGDTIYLMQHNGGALDVNSEIATFDRAWRRTGTIPLDGRACHNIVLLEDGTLLTCGSMAGELIGPDGLVVKVCDMLTRGLSVDATQVVVGGSELTKRSSRDQSRGEVYFLDRGYRRTATIELPGPVMEIRRIDGQDRGISRHLDVVTNRPVR